MATLEPTAHAILTDELLARFDERAPGYDAGNDVPLFLSMTSAERVEGGWQFTGRKFFGSLSPVWTYLGLHGMDTSDPARPRIVHAFLARDAKGYRIEETWDTLGMRATAS